jgi:GAF domain-containing protein/CheY-like chemotaxis protein/anti-sigma regulatory factor (Ser/Thr protein kinase)
MTGREHLRQIAHLARSVSSALALETVLKKVTAAVAELLPEAGCVIRMVDEEAGGYRLAAQGGAAAEGFPPLVPFGEGLTHAVVASRRPVLVSDGSIDPRSAWRSWANAGRLRGYYGIPIDAGDEVFGALNVFFPTGEVPPEDVREMFELLAGQAAVAIHNARLFPRSEAQRRAAESLAEMARAVSESLDPDEVGQRIVDGVRALFGAATAGFYRRRPKLGDLVAVAFAGNVGESSKEQVVYPLGISAVGLAARQRIAVVTRDVLADPRITLTPEARARIQKAAYRSALVVPLMAHDLVIGALAIGDRAGRVFTDDEVRLAEACAHQAALALENARLYREATQRRREAQELARVARLLTESLDSQAVAERIVHSLLPLVGARSSGLFLVQGDRSLRAVAWGGRARDHFEAGQVVPAATGISGRALATGMPSWTPDLMTDPNVVLTDDLRQRVGAMGNCAVIAVPLRVKGTIVGVLSVSDEVAREFSPSEVALLESFADHAAIALENARLYAETEQRRREAEQLARVARHLTETLDVGSVGERLVESVIPLFAVGASSLRLLRPDGALVSVASAGPIRASFGRGHVVPAGVGITGRVVTERRPIWTPDLLNDARFALTDDLRARAAEHGQRAILAVPLRLQGAIIGVLSIGDGPGREFTDAEVALVQVFADQAAIAVDNARLYHELAHRLGATEGLLVVAQSLTGTLQLSELARRAARQITRLLGADTSVFFGYDAANQVATALAGYHVPEAIRDPAYKLSIAESAPYVVEAKATGRPVPISEVATHPWRDEPAVRSLPLQPHSLLYTPILSKGRPSGAILSFWWTQRHDFTTDELDLAAGIANQVGLALENARLYAEVEEALAGLKMAQEGLVRAETLRAVGELAGGAAHHLNNLLTVVMGRLGLALAKLQAPELRRYLEPALKAARDSAEVVRRLQAFAHVNQVHLAELVDVNELVVDVIELTRPRWREEPNRRGLHIDVSLEPGVIPLVHAGPAALREALVNLVLNAIDALPSGGRIDIRTWAAQGWVYCAVYDTGVGMTPAIQRRALEPFFTTKGVKTTGLGLSVSYGILRRHGGDLTIESGAREGTTVTFRLPVAGERHETSPEVPAPPVVSAERPAPMTILVIDDELEVRATLVEMLEEQGHVVHQAGGGAEGLTALAGLRTIDVVFTDLGMPGMTGWEVARAIKARRPTLPVVLVTGWGTGSEETGPERGTVDLVLAKPLTNAALRAAIAEIVGRRPPLGQ